MLISLAEYAAKIKKDSSQVRRKAISGELPAIKIGRNWVIESDTPYPADKRIKTGKYKDWRKKAEDTKGD